MSIESQQRELQRGLCQTADVTIVAIFEEAKSAKAPGRPIFTDMLTRIQNGEADGIMAWAPDRLARNSIDGGRIVYLLDCGVLHDLKFATYTFENNSQGKFMLSIMFGQSKYYSDALSENVCRGNRTKLEHGWLPNLAPLGYLNDRATKTIVVDPEHFPIIRQIFDLMLSGFYTPRQIAVVARDEWMYRTPRRRKIGGGPLGMTSLYKILTNPFYAGVIRWRDETYPGKHVPVVSLHEFDLVQARLRRPSPTRKQKHSFPYTGVMRCGTCGYAITAQYTTNRHGTRYTYYYCVKQRLGSRCPEPAIEATKLEAQIVNFIASLTIQPAVGAWILNAFDTVRNQLRVEASARSNALEKERASIRTQLHELTSLRVRSIISDNEFIDERENLRAEERRIAEKIKSADVQPERIKPLGDFISFSIYATKWFSNALDHEKTTILKITASNPTLTGKILSIEATKPFLLMSTLAQYTSRLADKEDVQTPESISPMITEKLVALGTILSDPNNSEVLHGLRAICERFGSDEKIDDILSPIDTA